MNVIEMAIFAVTLNLDISIVSLNIGTRIRRIADLPILAFILASLQSAIPLAGYFIGNTLSNHLGSISRYFGSIILVATGYKILKESTKKNNGSLNQMNIFLFFIGTGLEDLIAGVSFGTFGGKIIYFFILFFAISYFMNFLALKIGIAIKRHINLSMDLFTGILLIIFGIISTLTA